MLLGQLQSLLSELYALDVSYDVHDFLVTDARIAAKLDEGGRQTDEKLLIAEGNEESAYISLYLGFELLERLEQNNPSHRLDAENLEDFWKVLEGISHFIYYAWNADLNKSVTLLEMELQAEVDKFVTTTLLLHRQGVPIPLGLHHRLFELPRFDARLDHPERIRYQDANHYAGKYCQQLLGRLSGGSISAEMKNELRRFYRFTQPAKIKHIEAG